MAFLCGFFNAVDNDRWYETHKFNHMFGGFIGEGVYATIYDGFAVTPMETGYGVVVASGRAFLDSMWCVNRDVTNVSIDPLAEPGQSRIDAVVLSMDSENRTSGIRVISGTPGTTPNPPDVTSYNTNKVFNHPLALVTVKPNQDRIDILDIEHLVGTEETPYSLGLLNNITMTERYSEWKQEFNDWFDRLQSEVTEEAISQYEGRINNILTQTEIIDSMISNIETEVNGIFTDRWFFRVFTTSGNFSVPQNIDIDSGLKIFAIGGAGGGGGGGGASSAYNAGAGGGGASGYSSAGNGVTGGTTAAIARYPHVGVSAIKNIAGQTTIAYLGGGGGGGGGGAGAGAAGGGGGGGGAPYKVERTITPRLSDTYLVVIGSGGSGGSKGDDGGMDSAHTGNGTKGGAGGNGTASTVRAVGSTSTIVEAAGSGGGAGGGGGIRTGGANGGAGSAAPAPKYIGYVVVTNYGVTPPNQTTYEGSKGGAGGSAGVNATGHGAGGGGGAGYIKGGAGSNGSNGSNPSAGSFGSSSYSVTLRYDSLVSITSGRDYHTCSFVSPHLACNGGKGGDGGLGGATNGGAGGLSRSVSITLNGKTIATVSSGSGGRGMNGYYSSTSYGRGGGGGGGGGGCLWNIGHVSNESSTAPADGLKIGTGGAGGAGASDYNDRYDGKPGTAPNKFHDTSGLSVNWNADSYGKGGNGGVASRYPTDWIGGTSGTSGDSGIVVFAWKIKRPT